MKALKSRLLLPLLLTLLLLLPAPVAPAALLLLLAAPAAASRSGVAVAEEDGEVPVGPVLLPVPVLLLPPAGGRGVGGASLASLSVRMCPGGEGEPMPAVVASTRQIMGVGAR